MMIWSPFWTAGFYLLFEMLTLWQKFKRCSFFLPFHSYPRKIQILVLEHYKKRDGVRYNFSSHCYVKTAEKNNFRKEGSFGSQLKAQAIIVKEVMVSETWGSWSQSLCSKGANRGESWFSAQFLLFLLAETAEHGMVPPTLRVGLLTSVNPGYKLLHQQS